jgi:hypothetical protein
MLYKSLALTFNILTSSYNIEILPILISKACLPITKNYSGKSLIIYTLELYLLRFPPLLRISPPISYIISKPLCLYLLLCLSLLLLCNYKSTNLYFRRTKTKRCQYRLVKRWYIWYTKLELFGGYKWIIPYDFDDFRPSFTFPLFDSKPSGFCSYYSTYRGSWYILHFTVPFSDLRTLCFFDSLYAFGFRFPPLLRMISAVSTLLYSPLYLILSPVIYVVAIAVIEVLAYTSIYGPFPSSIYGSLFRFSNLTLPSPRPVMPALRQ